MSDLEKDMQELRESLESCRKRQQSMEEQLLFDSTYLQECDLRYTSLQNQIIQAVPPITGPESITVLSRQEGTCVQDEPVNSKPDTQTLPERTSLALSLEIMDSQENPSGDQGVFCSSRPSKSARERNQSMNQASTSGKSPDEEEGSPRKRKSRYGGSYESSNSPDDSFDSCVEDIRPNSKRPRNNISEVTCNTLESPSKGLNQGDPGRHTRASSVLSSLPAQEDNQSDDESCASSQYPYEDVENSRKRKAEITEIHESSVSSTEHQDVTHVRRYINNDAEIMYSTMQTALQDVRRLNKEVSKLKHALDNAHSRIADMQPVQSGITESSAASTYRALVGNVQAWISDNLCDPTAEVKLPKRSKVRTQQCQRFFSLLPKSNHANMQDYDIQELNVATVIMNFLKKTIFDTMLFGALDDCDESLLRTTYGQIQKLVPKRTVANRRLWWTETMHGVMQRPQFSDQREQRTGSLSEELASMMELFTLGRVKEVSVLISSILENIMKPAIALAQDFALTQVEIKLRWTDLSKRPRPRQTIPAQAFNEYVLLDNNSHGKTMKSKALLQAKDYIYIADAVPALICQTNTGETRSITQPTILVEKRSDDVDMSDELEEGSDSILTLVWNKMMCGGDK